MDKKTTRLRRARKVRGKIARLRMPRLSVHRTGQHIYAQVIGTDQVVIAAANTAQAAVKADLNGTSNKEAAAKIGTLIAKMALDKGVEEVAFDRSGFKYHGRVQSLADAAREAGLKF